MSEFFKSVSTRGSGARRGASRLTSTVEDLMCGPTRYHFPDGGLHYRVEPQVSALYHQLGNPAQSSLKLRDIVRRVLKGLKL